MSNVLVYTTATCPWCIKVKEFLKKNKIAFSEKDVAEDEGAAKEAVEKSGQRGVPIIDIDGEIVVGFDEEKLKKLLKIK
jgi:glutaredoxin-like YruB-family protein|tara:strand:- start:261 stop:497 length:237 start_codon:yes stop_codon:yes gene_type:complete